MRNYVILAALSVGLMCCVLLFTTIGGKKKPTGKKTEKVVETSIEENTFQNDIDVSMTAAKPKDKEKIFEVMDGPRDTAFAHSMDEKFFTPYSNNDVQNMYANLAEKLDSIAKATAKKNKAKKDYVVEKE